MPAAEKRFRRSVREPISARVTNPARMKMAAETASIVRKLAKNSRKAPQAPSRAPNASDSPEVASGGVREVAIATPGNAGLVRSSTSARPPASPARPATNRSSKFGLVRASISGVTSSANGNRPRTTANATISSTPPNSATNALRNKRRSPRESANAMPKIGAISGETSMAPITTAALLASKPKAAIPPEASSST